MATTEVDEREPLHENDVILLEKILSNGHLVLATMSFATAMIRTHSAGRYHALVDVFGQTYQFRIREAGESNELVSNFRHSDQLLCELVWHRAAEAMLATRRGHRDAQLRKELRKPKTKQDD